MTRSHVSLTILGLVRNCATQLPATLAAIDAIRHRLKRSHCIIATNDNADDTDAVLADYAGTGVSCTVLNLDGLVETHPQRVERLALARNITLACMWQKDPLPFTLVLDLDGPNAGLAIDQLFATLDSAAGESWDALFANQVPAYYDIYALRHPIWCPGDAWREVARKRRTVLGLRSKKALITQLIHNRQFTIPPTQPRIPVTSAFGGLGLYRTSALAGAWYGARNAIGEIVCEHVTLHERMVGQGRRLFIDPALLTEAPAEHLGPTSGRPFPGFEAT